MATLYAMDAPLVTCDRKLATQGHDAKVMLMPRTQ